MKVSRYTPWFQHANGNKLKTRSRSSEYYLIFESVDLRCDAAYYAQASARASVKSVGLYIIA